MKAFILLFVTVLSAAFAAEVKLINGEATNDNWYFEQHKNEVDTNNFFTWVVVTLTITTITRVLNAKH